MEGLVDLEPTGVYLATYYHFDLAESGADDGAILSVVVDNLVFTRLDVLP